MTTTRPAHIWLTLSLIVVLGAAARVYHVNWQGLWHDEAGSMLVARAPLGEMFGYFLGPRPNLPFELNPPVYYYLLHAWTALFGTGDLQARLFSAFAGLAAVPLLFFLGERLYGWRAGLYAAALLAVSQLGVMFSQEVRAYALVQPFFVATMLWYLKARDSGRVRDWWLCTTSALLMVGTHYHAAFAIVALGLFTLLRWREIPLTWVAGAALAAALTLGPWAWVTFGAQVQKASASVMPSYYSVTLATPLTLLNRFSNSAFNGVLNPAPRWSYVVGGLLFGLPMLLMLVRALGFSGTTEADEPDATLFSLLMFAGPAAGALFAGAFLHLQYDIRYAAFAVVPYYVLVGGGLSRLRPSRAAYVLVAAVLVYSSVALRANYTVPYKENYRDAIRFVDAQARSTDCYAFVPFGVLPFEWPLYTSRPAGRLLTPDDALPGLASCGRIWVFTYHRVTVGNEDRWRAWLDTIDAAYTQKEARDFFWMHVERYDAFSGELRTP